VFKEFNFVEIATGSQLLSGCIINHITSNLEDDIAKALKMTGIKSTFPAKRSVRVREKHYT
jgi:hypothetical protein